MRYSTPLSYYVSIEDRPLRFYVMDVGEGLMVLLVFPDNTTMLFDSNVRQQDQEGILNYLSAVIPFRLDPDSGEEAQWIDVFVNSHRDIDHYRGLNMVYQEFEIKTIWDSGESGQTTQDNDYQYYMDLRRRLKDKYGDGAVVVPAPSLVALQNYGGAEVFCINSSIDYDPNAKAWSSATSLVKEVRIQHTNSIVLLIRYAGRSILLASDSDWKAWKEKIVPKFGTSGLLRANVLVASHHGSRSFFTDEQNDDIDLENNPESTFLRSIEYIDPSITLISCGEYETYHHPNPGALEIYEEHTAYKQVYTTYDKGTFAGFIGNDGNWTVCPSRFDPRRSRDLSFQIDCRMSYNGSECRAQSGDEFPIGSNVAFTLLGRGGILDPYSALKVWWEVSNGGVNDDHEHQEIYDKDENHEPADKLRFNRDVAYEGIHLLRCRLKNSKKSIDITQVFVVRGVKR